MSSFTIHKNAYTPEHIKLLFTNPDSIADIRLKRSPSSYCTDLPDDEHSSSANSAERVKTELVVSEPRGPEKQKFYKIKNVLLEFRQKRDSVKLQKIKFNSKIVQLKEQNNKVNRRIKEKFRLLDSNLDDIEQILNTKL